MNSKSYWGRHGRRLASMATASLVAAGATLSGAKADIAPPVSGSLTPPAPPAAPSDLSKAIFTIPHVIVPVQPALAPAAPPPPAEPVIAFTSPLPGHAVNSRFGMR